MTVPVTKPTWSDTNPFDEARDQAIVEVWLATIDDARTGEADMARLDPDEQARARRLRFDRDRACFVNRRVFLRDVLARYVQSDPGRLRFTTSGNGRPELAGHGGLSFNASHSSTMAVVVVTRGRTVGVDIERLRTLPDGLDVAEAMFSPREIESVRSAVEPERSATFLRLWTRKEAVVKALGTGLSTPLADFDVSSVDRAGVGHTGRTAEVVAHTYVDLAGIPAHVGAVAMAGLDVRPDVRMREMA